MESQGDSSLVQATKTTGKVAKCCFVITVGSDGLIEISTHNPGSDSEGAQNEPRSMRFPMADQSMKQLYRFPVLKEVTNSSKNNNQEVTSKDKSNKNKKQLHEIEKTKVKIRNKDSAKRRSVVVKDRLKKDLEQPKVDQSIHNQDTQKNNTSCDKINRKTTDRIEAGNSSFSQEQQQHQKLNEQKQDQLQDKVKQQQDQLQQMQKQQQNMKDKQDKYLKDKHQQQQQHETLQQQFQQPFGNNSPYVTLSFLPFNQTEATAGCPAVYPCQQFLSAAPSNMSGCSCCTCSNCCSPRTSQVCQMPLSCSFNPCDGNNCCMLKPGKTTNSTPMEFSGQFSQNLVQPVLQQQHINFPLANNLYSGFPCQLCSCNQNSHYKMHHCCHCPGFLNNQQNVQQLNFQQQHLQQQHLQHQRLQQQHFQQQQSQNVCCPRNASKFRKYPTKEIRIPKASEKQSIQNEEKHVLKKLPEEVSKLESQEQSEDQSHIPIKNEEFRSVGGASPINIQSTSLCLDRLGRTCFILRPANNAMMPRLLTKRISRYTSVISWPTKNLKSL
ncbi:mediator of RNA polymerase II transcription subunit 15 [Drosophila ficusphila]|uniref:mediator of RNA polymerase II transcription subunit 15 n=1 Tax=Drosophila ficusphila TaxID=30025 RepID=UPI0007E5D29F|nr:mediator of RNA polymerase II transcription subunit 15 [Drosophila ficusphila]